MKMIDISTASKPLSEYVGDLDDGLVVITSNNKPVFAIVSLENIDLESLVLSTNREFLEIIAQAREEVAAGNTVSLEEMKEDFPLE